MSGKSIYDSFKHPSPRDGSTSMMGSNRPPSTRGTSRAAYGGADSANDNAAIVYKSQANAQGQAQAGGGDKGVIEGGGVS